MNPASLPTILANYDALIVDLWGVIHDGDKLYPGVLETLRMLHEAGKPVVFLSNAPRLAENAGAILAKLKIPRDYYQDIVTSGQVAHDILAADASPRSYYYLGPDKDMQVLEDVTHLTRVDNPAAADFVLCTGYPQDGQPHADVLPLLAQLKENELPLLCVNPDIEVVKQDGTHMLCAGAVAASYTEMGGKAAYIGKPFLEVYAAARACLTGYRRILCVGDNPITDIKGANDAGLDSLLITGGVLKVRYGESLSTDEARQVCDAAGLKPTHILPAFAGQ